MRENTMPEIIQVIDEAETPVLLLVVSENCNEGKPLIQENLENKIIENNRPVALFTVCMPEEALTFPRPVSPQLYYYLPKNQTPVFWRGADMVPNLVKDIEVIEKMMVEGLSHEDARYDDEKKAHIKKTDTIFEKEKGKTFPPKLEQARNFAKAMWGTAKRGMNNLPIITTAKEGGRRLAICEACPSFDTSSSRCRECGCVMSLKSQLVASTCPLNKWETAAK